MSFDDNLWEQLSKCLREKRKLGKLSFADAQKLYDEAEEVEISKERIDEHVRSIVTNTPLKPPIEVEPFKPANDRTEIDNQVFQLFKNEGISDSKAEELEKHLEMEMLEEEDDET